ncbi:DNA-directed RNA polymerase sigma-70 factor [Emticicia aquatilis]|uniref:DNA-directed RNA polymerase sigma-70 factor n=1 Tax=Emticicia aquatilis TaxID=1537369 RepID=A0A916Z499_9BACT|nr:sigma-70 family RNA polymerase sigma factor [Emticicia aquatilis]GGD75180.1 DNA-directed RNA polymerase sigma-70 factor [Emticicia aquatilis]
MFFKRFSKPKPTTDAEYLAAYQATGNLELLGELYERYMEMVFAVCFKYLRDEDESKDAVMQIFEELVVKLRTHSVENFRSWLHSVARNHCLMHLRSNRLQTEGVDFFEDGSVENEPFEHQSDEPFELEQNLSKMTDCLETLSDEQRTSIRLFYLEEKCYKEITDLTGYDLNKVKSYIQNGKRNLKICIEKKHE